MTARAAARMLMLLLVGFALSAAAPAPPLVRVRIGIPAPTVNMLPMWVADARGFFRANGLDIQIVQAAGGSQGLAAVRSGQLHAMNVGLSAVIDANAKGADFVMIAASANTMSFGLYAAANVTSAAALRGQKVGISTPGSESDVAAALALRQLGLTRTDVTFVPAGTTIARAEALVANRIAATALNEPVSNVAELRGLPKLVDLDGTTPWILNGIVLRKSAVGQNRGLVLAFLKAYIEAIHYALANPQETQTILSARYGMLEPAVAQATYEDFKQRIPRDAAPSQTAAENMLRELPALGTQVGSTNASDYLDLSYIEELRRDGTIAALQAKYGTQ